MAFRTRTSIIADTALLGLRGVVGGYLAAHGAQKLFGAVDGPGLDGTGQQFEEHLDLAPGREMAAAAGASELAAVHSPQPVWAARSAPWRSSGPWPWPPRPRPGQGSLRRRWWAGAHAHQHRRRHRHRRGRAGTLQPRSTAPGPPVEAADHAGGVGRRRRERRRHPGSSRSAAPSSSRVRRPPPAGSRPSTSTSSAPPDRTPTRRTRFWPLICSL